MIFIFSSWPKVEYQQLALTKRGASDRLFSYWYLKDLPDGYLERLVRDGYVIHDAWKTEKIRAVGPLILPRKQSLRRARAKIGPGKQKA